MPTPIAYPALGVKHSETPTISVVGGDELVQAIRPLAADPTKFENVNVPVELLGTGGGANALELATNRHLFPDAVLPAVQAALTAGTLVWIIDASSSQRTTIQASQFGVSPTNTASQNAAGVDAMRSYILSL